MAGLTNRWSGHVSDKVPIPQRAGARAAHVTCPTV